VQQEVAEVKVLKMKTAKILTVYSIVFLCCLVAIMSAATAQAQDPFWQPVPIRSKEQKAAGLVGGEGFQMVLGIAYAPSDPSIVYLSTDTSQVWKSVDGGQSWQSKNSGFVANGARSIIVDPHNANIVFAAGFVGANYHRAQKYRHRLQGIYRSTDGGESWRLSRRTEFYKQPSKGSLFAFDSSTSEAFRTNTVYAGSPSEGLLQSKDGGESWQSVGFQGQNILDIEENPGRAGELYVATEDGLYSYYRGGIRKIGRGLPNRPKDIALCRNDPRLIYAALGEEGVYKSVDGGLSFRATNSGLPVGVDFSVVSVSPVDSDIVFVKADRSPFREPLYSHDGAESWHVPESTNVGNLSLDGKDGFWFSAPFAPHPTSRLTVLTISNGKGQILKTSDAGKHWTYTGAGFTGGRMRGIAFSKDGRMIFSLTDHGLWLTKDRGSTFRQLKVKRVFGLKSSRSAAVRGKTLVASLGTWSKKGLVVSHDLGKSWSYFDSLIDTYDFVAFHPQLDTIIYAGPYRSENSGRDWRKLPYTVRALYHADGDVLYALTSAAKTRSRVMKSTDRGNSWHAPYPDCPIAEKKVKEIAVAPDDPDRIYLATSNGLWLFDGERWTVRNARDGLAKDYFGMCFLNTVAVDLNNPHLVYAGRRAPGCGQSNGIFRSRDRGVTWENITSNLGPELTVWSVQISPVDSAVYIGTSLGTFRLNSPAH
jgi:photosystem II stability/assembly factor-like uncharacterized protein